MKLKSFCTAKVTVIRLRWQPRQWKKIISSYAYEMGLMAKIYRELKNGSHRESMAQLRNGDMN
jgi:hypothetical protein